MPKWSKSSLRIALVGECNVGKTSIARTFLQKHVNKNTKMTIGVDKHEQMIKMRGETFDLTLLDMSGGYKFQSIVESYLNRVDAVLFVYDLTDKESFAKLPYWNRLVDNSTTGQHTVSKILVGNKKDLSKYRREVRSKTAKNYARFEEMVYLEVSARNDDNIELAFQCIANEIIAKHAKESERLKELRRQPIIDRKLRLGSFVPWIRNLKSLFDKSWNL